MKQYSLTIVFILVSIYLSAQELSYLKKADKAKENTEYAKALEYYNKVLEIKNNNIEANKGIGIVLGEYMERYEEAIPYLEKVLTETGSDTITTVYYTLGKCYHHMGEYKKALFYYTKLQEYKEIGNPLFSIFLNKRISDCEYALSHQQINQTQSVKNIGNEINTSNPEYVPIFTNDNKLIFTSKRKDDQKEKINSWDGKYFESMYISKLENEKYSTPLVFKAPNDPKDHKFFKKLNESNVSLSSDKNILFIYQDGDLYETPMKGNGKQIKKLSKNINIARYQNHAALSKDNKTIFFSSESKQGIGGTDIFMSVKNDKDEWSEAVMLDTIINTIFNEDAPFIGEDGTLYFSSAGHPGYGGYDVYKTHMQNGHWSKPENLGQPINSPGQDIYFSLVGPTTGYYSSSRTGGYGDMDIYSVDLAPNIPQDTVSKPLAAFIDSSIMETKKQDSVISTLYLPEEELKNLNWNSTPLNFNYNEFTIRNDAFKILDQNAEILNKNPDLNIAIYGYSDSRGNEKYNKYLSLNRAETVKQYFLSKGIKKFRIKTIEGFGESGLLNICGDGIECSEEQHEQNRRVEIKIFNSNYKDTTPVVKGQK